MRNLSKYMLRLFIWYFMSSTEVVAVSQLAINYAN